MSLLKLSFKACKCEKNQFPLESVFDFLWLLKNTISVATLVPQFLLQHWIETCRSANQARGD
jgi:hypothetical protein